MKFIKVTTEDSFVKRSKGSTNMPLDENSAVTVLYSKEEEFNTVKNTLLVLKGYVFWKKNDQKNNLQTAAFFTRMISI